MALFRRERKGLEWKRGWTSQFLASLSPPPLPLLSILAVSLLFLFLSGYISYKSQVTSTINHLHVLLMLSPLLLILAVRWSSSNERLLNRLQVPPQDAVHRVGSMPWGVAFFLILLLVMVSYQSSFHSKWFRPLWRSY
ncbi:hypothetical protein AMTRI_Chr09g40610 [Amborella trichopoda]|uniref:Transmembrane protein n=1 Tax=Amborella trichopoda TaxID=13333 RepID=W1PU07_AMBTC|nr:hypothetical protein AMTR_s00041p00224270 [Amborella trichopoda]